MPTVLEGVVQPVPDPASRLWPIAYLENGQQQQIYFDNDPAFLIAPWTPVYFEKHPTFPIRAINVRKKELVDALVGHAVGTAPTARVLTEGADRHLLATLLTLTVPAEPVEPELLAMVEQLHQSLVDRLDALAAAADARDGRITVALLREFDLA